MRSGIERILTERGALGGKSFYEIYRIFRNEQACVRLRFLDFPIFLDSNSIADPIQSLLTLRILRESSKLVCGHGICQTPAGRSLFLSRSFLEFFWCCQ